ncbi:MAG TPA: hypothetical protein PLI45_02090 [Candidatus Woesebacteria bacterium]|nr:hypothetical protein [Candidatus Woesebacteria bacterium]
MKLKIFVLASFCAIALSFPITSQAANALTVRLGQPKTPTNQSNLKLTFVALEIGGTDNIAVSCFKKSPSDSDYVKFQDISLIPGGNTDYCSVDNTILNTIGAYSFKVVANGVKESNIVSIDFNTSGPSAPVSYSKEKINDCDYKIKFKTANDGRTTKIELYRSDTNSISINSDHFISSQSIVPDTTGEITNSIPTCGKEYFYAIRAVDNYGNVSGIVGDSFTTVITTGTTTTINSQTAIPVTSGSQVAAGVSTAEEPTANVSVSPSESQSASSSAVLGISTDKLKNLKWLAIPLLLLSAYFFRKARKRS